MEEKKEKLGDKNLLLVEIGPGLYEIDPIRLQIYREAYKKGFEDGKKAVSATPSAG